MRFIKASVVTASLVFSAFCLLCMVSFGLLPAQPAGGRAAGVGNGDTNGDGQIDVSDAVHLLLFLFRGGEPPAAIADSPELVERVAAIEAGFERLLASVDEKLERIAVATESIADPCEDRFDRFVDNGDGTVTDACTGLMWQQLTDFNLGRVEWQVAVDAVAGLELAGHRDWRLPTVRELSSLHLFNDIPAEPGPDPVFSVASDFYWSATPAAGSSQSAWLVSLERGGLRIIRTKGFGASVLAVRDP